jgi:glycosyltransferase involved in cell wall biosynthesis
MGISMERTVTVGVPVYNEERTIYQTLESIIKSAEKMGAGYEVVVCFNGTTDNGQVIAERFNQEKHPLRIIESQNGKSKAINAIVNASDSEYLLFCDGDVIVEEDCFKNLIRRFSNKDVIAVTGAPRPWEKNEAMYRILNARMTYPLSEIAKKPIDGFTEKPFIHGRSYAIRRQVFQDMGDAGKFERSIGDDTYLTHYVVKKFGRKAIFRDIEAVVNYLPVQSLKSWWLKWSRIWSDLDKLYKENPDFVDLRPFMQTKLNWEYVFKLPMPVPFYFVLERVIHHFGKAYFNLTKQKCDYSWQRLNDTKVIPK